MLRPPLWVVTLVFLALIANIAPVQARPLSNGVILVDPSDDPPADLLDSEEVERISRLQSADFPLPLSAVSPNDESLLIDSDEGLALLDLADGALRPIDPLYFERFVPLPFVGFSAFHWLDAETLGVLAVDLGTSDPELSLVRMLIDRTSLDIRLERTSIPAGTAIVSVAPDLRQLLLVLLPEEEGMDEEMLRAVGVRVNFPLPSQTRFEQHTSSQHVQRSVDRAHNHPLLQRIWGWEEGEEGLLATTPRTLDLVLATTDDPELRYVTTISEASTIFGEAWSSDSRRLAFSIYGLADYEDQRPTFDGARISDEIYRDVTGNLPPELNPILQNNNSYDVDILTGEVRILRPEAGSAPPILRAEGWSPDGETLLVTAWYPARLRGRTYPIYTPQFSERLELRLYNRELRETGRLTSDRFSGSASASVRAELVSSDEIIFRASGLNRHVYYWNRVSGELRTISDRAGSYYNVMTTHQSRELVFTHASFSNPPDLYRMGWDGQGLVRLTWLNEALRQFANLREDPVRFTLPSGVVREGTLIQPADAPFPPRNTRIVIWQEGGPGAPMNNSWSTSVEAPFALLPGMGMALLVTPVAGRPGATAASFNSLVDGTNFGAIDIDEQAAIARDMIRRGWTSPAKLGITGCSYGGYFTLQSLVRHPDLYAAANPQCALVDLFTEWSRGYTSLAPYMMGLPPYILTEEYRRDSPVYNTARIRAALLTFHGVDDFLPIVQNENLHLQLANRDLPARMVRFVDEGHGLMSEDNQRYAAQEQVHWFRLHLR